MSDGTGRFSVYANPARFLTFAKQAGPILWGCALFLLGAGLYLALFASPPDYQQGESVRIMYVHVPAAWMALFGYSFLAGASALSLVFRHPLSDVAAKASAPVGAVFTALALITGSLWGKPMWGAWWVWDARLTSVLVLLFLYLGYLAVWRAIEIPQRAAKVAGVLALVGFVNVPVIKFSVDWWTTLHQPASVFRLQGPTIDTSMLVPLFVMGGAYMFLFLALVLLRMRTEIGQRRLRALMMNEI